MPADFTPLFCEIHAPRAAQAAALAEIAVACARDVGQPLLVKTLLIGGREKTTPVLTLHLPVELAPSRHQVWCLACRLACFCPQARISVLVTGAAFATPARARPQAPRRRSA
jgi:hypothetical protein